MGRQKRTQRFRCKQFTNPSGKKVWRVQGHRLSGERIRENYKTKAEGLERMNALEQEAAEEPMLSVPTLQRTSLTPAQISDAEAALEITPHGLAYLATSAKRWEAQAAAKGLTVDEAMDFFERRYHPELKEMTILQARDKFLATRRNIEPRTLSHYESATQRLLSLDPNKAVHRVTVIDLEQILARYSNANTYRTYRRCFSTFFRWAVRQRLCVENPCERLELPLPDMSHVTILSLEEVKRLLKTATIYHGGVMVSVVVIALFAGLRPSEIEDLKPSDIRDGKIMVSGGKLRRMLKRTVPISDALGLWLQQFPFRGIPKNLAGKMRALKKAVKAAKWVQDILRHTSISFQLERDKNESLTAFNNGTSVQMINRHYRDVIEDHKVVETYWELTPEWISAWTFTPDLPAAAKTRWPVDAALQKMVTSTPLRQLAKTLGVSDVAIRKHCLKKGIQLIDHRRRSLTA